MTTSVDTTVVVVPRERYSLSLESLRGLYAGTDHPFDLVYVAGRAPRGLRAELQREAEIRGFDLVLDHRFLAPNHARAIGLERVTTEFVVFVDNDVFVQQGWLEPLVECARETGAGIVGPLYFEGDPADAVVHMAGGTITCHGERPHRRLHLEHLHQGRSLADVDEPVERCPVDFVEFHCVLVRTDVFDTIGPLDPRLMSTREHIDLCLRASEAGIGIWFEPASRVTYSTPPPFATSDLPFYLTRWSEHRNRTSLEHYCAKYDLDTAYVDDRLPKMRGRRQRAFEPIADGVGRVLGTRARRLTRGAINRGEPVVNRVLVRDPKV